MRYLLSLISVVAVSANLLAQEAPVGKRYFIAIAVTRYDNPAKFRALAKPESDAEELQQLLTANHPSKYAMILCEKNGQLNGVLKPTTKNLRDILQSLSTVAKAEDEIIFYAGGHGFENESGSVFCTSEASFTDPNSMIYVKEIVDRITAMAPKRKLILIDACREFRDNLDVKMMSAENPLGETTHQKKIDSSGTRVVIEACNPGQYAYEMPKTQSGILTTALLEGLKNRADKSRDGQVSIRELIDHVRVAVPRMARETRQVSQAVDIRDGSDASWELVSCPVPAEAPTTNPIKSTPAPDIAQANLNAPLGSQLDVRQPNFGERMSDMANRGQINFDIASGRWNVSLTGMPKVSDFTSNVPVLNGAIPNMPNIPANLRPAIPNVPNIPNIPPQIRRFIP